MGLTYAFRTFFFFHFQFINKEQHWLNVKLTNRNAFPISNFWYLCAMKDERWKMEALSAFARFSFTILEFLSVFIWKEAEINSLVIELIDRRMYRTVSLSLGPLFRIITVDRSKCINHFNSQTNGNQLMGITSINLSKCMTTHTIHHTHTPFQTTHHISELAII